MDKSSKIKWRENKVETKEAGDGAEGADVAEPEERPAWVEVPDYATATEGDEPRNTDEAGKAKGNLPPPLIDAAADVEAEGGLSLAEAEASVLPSPSPTAAGGGEGDTEFKRGKTGEGGEVGSASIASTNAPPFYCGVCDIQTTSQTDFDRHKSSKKHKKQLKGHEEAAAAVTSSKVNELSAAIEKARYQRAHHKPKKQPKTEARPAMPMAASLDAAAPPEKEVASTG